MMPSIFSKSGIREIIRIDFKDTLFGPSAVLFVLCVLIAIVWGVFGGWPDIGDLHVEFFGLIFDVLVILVGFGIIQHRKQRRDDIARHSEVIEDLKRWQSEETKHRVLGAMRRLNRLGTTKFDLTGANLKGASFAAFGVKSIAGSILSNGKSWGDDEQTTSRFESVDFSRIDARGVIFEEAFPMRLGRRILGHGPRAIYKDCDFWNSKLSGAKFDGAKLVCSEKLPESLEEIVDVDPDGRPHYAQVAYGQFDDVDLSKTSFKFCTFKWIDFRKAICVEDAVFTGAQGLETCVFDSEELKQEIILKSKGKTS